MRIRARERSIFVDQPPYGRFLFDGRPRTTYALSSLAFIGRAHQVHTEHSVGCGTLGENRKGS